MCGPRFVNSRMELCCRLDVINSMHRIIVQMVCVTHFLTIQKREFTNSYKGRVIPDTDSTLFLIWAITDILELCTSI